MPSTLRFFAFVFALFLTSGQAREPQQGAEAVSSITLIDRALAARTIDPETADRYRIFAAFGDTRLPVAYRGSSSGVRALLPLVTDVGTRLASLSPATQAELAPFFMRPEEAGSWVTLATIPGQEPGGSDEAGEPTANADGAVLRGPFETDGSLAASPPTVVAWQSVSAVGGKARVWWQDRYAGDAALAAGLASELTSVIWGRLTGLMNQEPFSDNGIVNNGGGSAFDFYLVHPPASTEWVGFTPSSLAQVPCHPGRYVLIDSRRYGLGNARTYGIIQVATHELMHAITFAYNVRNGCPEPWIGEASGDWASNWIYPLTDQEHTNANDYLKSVEYSLPNPKTPQGDRRYYGEHMLPYFLEQVTGGTGFMPRMWANFRTMNALEGVNAVMPGGFAKSWPKFLVQLWNRPPVDAPNGFRQWDRFPVGTLATGGLDVVRITSGVETRSITFKQQNMAELVLATGVQPIAGHYRHYQFDRSVRSVTFQNTIRQEAILHGTVWGIEMIGGSWKQPVDWTEELQKSWCRDEATEDIEQLVIVFGNIDFQNLQVVNPRKAPTVEASGTGCSGWIGSDTVENIITSQDPAVRIVETVTSTIHFAIDSALVRPGRPREYWKSVAGTLNWRVNVTGACTGSASGTVGIPDSPDDHVADLRIWSEGGQMHHLGGNGPWPGDIPKYTITCTNGTTTDMVLISALGFFVTDGNNDLLAPDGKSFSGRHASNPAPGINVSHAYSFRCTTGC